MNHSDFLPYRQIHLDFHTSEAIQGIGADFDADEWADMLVKAHINSITVFARCHHGWTYYPSKKHPERVHPHLERNLLKEQIDACHARGIRCPLYTTIQWDHYTAMRHPEWILIDEHGKIDGTEPFEAGFYRWMNVNSPYREFLKDHTEELLSEFDVDGFFFDITHPRPSTDPYTREQMLALDMNPADAQDRQRFADQSLNEFMRDMSDFVRNFKADCNIFYNAGHVGPRLRATSDAFSHWELESLPSGGWGYIHFPLAQRYARNLGLDTLGMTGKFHTSWGDFHSLKNLPALQFECFQMLAMNAKCSIGDQLPPRGKLDVATYELIGQVYAEVEEKEPWCAGATPVSEIGLFTPEEFTGERITPSTSGAIRMLQEGGHQFEILDSTSNLNGYRVLVLPDRVAVSSEFGAKLQAFVDNGGALIASFESGLDLEQSAFSLDALGVTKVGDGPRDLSGNLVRGKNYSSADYVEYLLPTDEIGVGLPETEHAMFMRGLEIVANSGAETLASIVPSYFDRTWEHFCSHRQTPSSGEVGQPGIVRNGEVIYFSNPIFTQYNQNAPRWCKTLFLNALKMLLPDPLLRHDGPTSVLATINEQKDQNRWIIHLLHYIPERRGLDFDVIEDVIPLYDVAVSLSTTQAVTEVLTAPQGSVLDYEAKAGRVEFTLPKLNGHQMIEVRFLDHRQFFVEIFGFFVVRGVCQYTHCERT